MSELVTVARFRDLPLAELARGKLNAEGIPAFLADQYLVGLRWDLSNAIGGLRLQVPRERAGEARDILNADDSAALAELQSSTLVGRRDSCPSCGSADIRQKKLSRRSGAISLILSLPILFWGTRLVCQQCGRSWSPQRHYEPFPDIPAAADPDDVASGSTGKKKREWSDNWAWWVWIFMGVACVVMLVQYTR